jgi:hypothetical protein
MSKARRQPSAQVRITLPDWPESIASKPRW